MSVARIRAIRPVISLVARNAPRGCYAIAVAFAANAPRDYFFTSNRRVADQLPPPISRSVTFARTRHHMVSVGSVLVLNCEAASV